MSIAQVVVQSPEQVETLSTELPSSQIWSPSSAVNRPLRLQLSPSIGKGALDGAWWPHGRDLSAEALDLVDHFPASFDRICRVVYSTADWDQAPRRIKAAEVFVSLASFPRDDTHRVLLKSVAAYRPGVLQLLLVPPEWDDRAARHAMRIAAMPSNVKLAATILSESEDQHRAGLLSHWDDDGGANPTLQRGPEPAYLAKGGQRQRARAPVVRSAPDRRRHTQNCRVTPFPAAWARQ